MEIVETDVPGSVLLVDIGHHLTEQLHDGNRDILLIPAPTSSPRDPLNWPRYKKPYTLFLCSLYACVLAYGENSLGAAWTTVSIERGVSLTNMNGGSALNYLLLGFGNCLWIPVANKLGRKFVYIACMIVSIPGGMWVGAFHGVGQWYGSNFLGGLGTSIYEALIQLTVFDMFFAHEHGIMLATYIFGQQLGAVIGGLSGGFITEGPGWSWCQYILGIACAGLAIIILFTMDDTMFPRAHLPTTINRSVEEHPGESTTTPDVKTSPLNDKSVAGSNEQIDTAVGEVFDRPRTYLEILNPIHRFKEDKTTFWQYFKRPFILFLFPNVLISGLLFAFGSTSGIVAFNTISEIIESPPYNWNVASAGFLFLASLVGACIGYGTGYIGDYVVIFLARRNNGYKEPEMRLWTLGLSLIYTTIGYFTYGWGAEEGAHWIAIAIGFCCLTAQQVSTNTIATAYAMECFDKVGGEIVVVMACCSSVINFVISFTVQDMINGIGYGWTFTFYGLVVLMSVSSALALIYWGKSWRRKCSPRYYKFLAETSRI